ncbi:hypothetical protein [Aeromonas veronii]|uniref:hypothetical protein n=1 Tax=Aeromonas veronii TaxID=654 RepID=UPI003D1C404C
MSNAEYLELQYKQAIEEIELYAILVDELRNEISDLKPKLIADKTEYPFISEDDNYLRKYPDVLKIGMSAREHYMKYGKALGRRWG